MSANGDLEDRRNCANANSPERQSRKPAPQRPVRCGTGPQRPDTGGTGDAGCRRIVQTVPILVPRYPRAGLSQNVAMGGRALRQVGAAPQVNARPPVVSVGRIPNHGERAIVVLTGGAA